MSESNDLNDLNDQNDWETRVQNLAKMLPYPPTPDIAASLRRRRRVGVLRLAQAAAALLIVVLALLAVPDIRAGVIAFFRIGAVSVQVTTATPPASFGGGEMMPSSVIGFPGETTLDDARQNFGYPIDLPAALPAPDRVYLIKALQPMVVLAWLEANGGVDVSLHLLPPGTYGLKMYEGELEETQVNGARALWLPNPHMYMVQTGRDQFKRRDVLAQALVWEAPNGITYRLETDRPLDEALRIAESIPTASP
jgi:hypothetical protein